MSTSKQIYKKYVYNDNNFRIDNKHWQFSKFKIKYNLIYKIR